MRAWARASSASRIASSSPTLPAASCSCSTGSGYGSSAALVLCSAACRILCVIQRSVGEKLMPSCCCLLNATRAAFDGVDEASMSRAATQH